MFEKIVTILQEYSGADRGSIVPDARLTADLGLNSLDVINIVVAFEEEFGVEIPSEDLESIVTVGDEITYLKNRGVTA